ncbi:MAG: helix-turn-helix domain-containing protein [Chloroflexi bacterium]|nr:helix-turn-helix domain-containing protein [Chloroflexota bacterium]
MMNPEHPEIPNPLDFRAPNKTKQDVAKFLGVTVGTVESMMAQSGLPFYRLGTRRVRFRYSDVLTWMEEKNKVA